MFDIDTLVLFLNNTSVLLDSLRLSVGLSETRKQVEMLKQHEIQKSHARENVLYDVIMGRSTRNTRLRISRFSCIRTPQ